MMQNKALMWLRAAGVRALKTMAQSALGMLSGEMLGMLDVDWVAVLSVAFSIYEILRRRRR